MHYGRGDRHRHGRAGERGRLLRQGRVGPFGARRGSDRRVEGYRRHRRRHGAGAPRRRKARRAVQVRNTKKKIPGILVPGIFVFCGWRYGCAGVINEKMTTKAFPFSSNSPTHFLNKRFLPNIKPQYLFMT